MMFARSHRGGTRLPLAVLVAASVITVTMTGASAAPADAEDPTTTTAPTTATTAPVVEGEAPIVGPHNGVPTDVPVDPDAPPDLNDLVPADPAAPAPLLRDPTPHIRVLLAELTLIEAQRAVPAAQAGLHGADAELTNRRLDLSAAKQQLGVAQNALKASRSAMGDFAVRSFMHANGGATASALTGDVYEQRKGEQLTSAVLEHQNVLIEDANQAVREADGAVMQAENAVRAAEAVVAQEQEVVDFADDLVANAQEALTTAKAADHDKLFDRDVDGGRASRPDRDAWQLTIAGQSVFTVEELQAWFRQWKVAPQASVPGDELAKLYVEEGNLENIRGDVMLAQSIWETGTFSNRDTRLLNNFAGVGHCDTCSDGFAFGSARDGVRGQAQLLKSYVEVNPTLANPIVDRRLRGPAGCCQTWNQLTGVWATDGRYGPLILGLYEDMLEWLLMARLSNPVPPIATP